MTSTLIRFALGLLVIGACVAPAHAHDMICVPAKEGGAPDPTPVPDANQNESDAKKWCVERPYEPAKVIEGQCVKGKPGERCEYFNGTIGVKQYGLRAGLDPNRPAGTQWVCKPTGPVRHVPKQDVAVKNCRAPKA